MSDKCPRCKKTVYHAEKVLGGGSAWHKQCFKCPECNKRLDSANLAVHKGEAYCKACHSRLFAPKGYGFGQGAGALSMDSQKPKTETPSGSGGGSSNFCGDCGVKSLGGKFCQECGAPQGNNASAKPSWSPSPASSSPKPAANSRPSPAARGFGGGGVKKPIGGSNNPNACGKCGKTVYHAEKAIGAGKIWHKKCFKCPECNRKLDSANLREHDGVLYCSTCHAAKWGPKGYGFGGGAGALARTQ